VRRIPFLEFEAATVVGGFAHPVLPRGDPADCTSARQAAGAERL
jgi:hypothetical protein